MSFNINTYREIHSSSDKNALISYMNKYQEEEKHNWNYNYLFGQAYRNINDYKKSIEFYKKALNLAKNLSKEDLSSIKNALGIAYQLNKDYNNAIILFKEAIEDNQYNILNYNSLGLTYNRVKDYINASGGEKSNSSKKYYIINGFGEKKNS